MGSRTITNISQCARCDRICNNVSDYNNRNVVINFTPSIPYSLNVTNKIFYILYIQYCMERSDQDWYFHPCFYGDVINKAKNGNNYKIIEKSYS